MADVVQRQADAGIDVVSDGEMGKASFIAYTDERLTGFTPVDPEDSAVPASNQEARWERRLETRHEWRAFREYHLDYLPREMPPSAPAAVRTDQGSQFTSEAFIQTLQEQGIRVSMDGKGLNSAGWTTIF